MDKLILNPAKLLNSRFGHELSETVKSLDSFYLNGAGGYSEARAIRERLSGKWEAFQLTIEYFYGIHYNFIRNDDYYGVYSEIYDHWLIKEYRRTRNKEGIHDAD